ncbi:MAG: hypothetical protein DRP78_00785 [Candidatus Omnitrophota bacterium]|nr:MAG: hypothetical protein DRP78_00785 [Candidatus Omnitrophota bacterium]
MGSNPTSSAINTNLNPCAYYLIARGFEFLYAFTTRILFYYMVKEKKVNLMFLSRVIKNIIKS